MSNESSATGSPRAFVLGLDGVPWNLIESWAAAGELPNFERLLETGAAGPLQSTRPATTALAWPSIATGVWPDKHGVYGFQHLRSDHTQRSYTSDQIAQPELWDLLAPAVVGNVPMTYPAADVDGRMVTGMLTPELDERATHPSDLASEIESRIPDYRIDLPWRDYVDDEADFLTEVRSAVETRRELMRLLMEATDWRLFFFVYTAPDRLQHLVWDEDVLIDHYRHLDEILGEVVEYVSEVGGNLFVVSDHGFGPLSKTVHVNRILESEGYLARRADAGTRGLLSRLGIDKETVRALPRKLGVDEAAVLEALPDPVVDAVASQVPGDHALYDIDYGNTAAFLHGPGNVYVNDSVRFSDGWVDPADVPAVKRELRSLLDGVTDPATGEPALSVFDGDDLFPTDDRSPDLVVEGNDGYTVLPSMRERAFVASDTRDGGHREEGVFLAWGPDVEPGSTPTDATVVDVAPTVLRSVGASSPENLDGRVLDEVLDLDPDLVKSAPAAERRVAASADSTAAGGTDYDAIEDRLRGLGYVE